MIIFSFTKIHNLPGFSTNLLQLVMSDQVQMPVRQAGAIYLKNLINQFWLERKVDKPNELMPHSLQENEKVTIRDNIIEAVIHSPDPIRLNNINFELFLILLPLTVSSLF